jgi:hypothetical protein
MAGILPSYYNSGRSNPVSRITIGSLADLGYQVNPEAADPYTPTTGEAMLPLGGFTVVQGLVDVSLAAPNRTSGPVLWSLDAVPTGVGRRAVLDPLTRMPRRGRQRMRCLRPWATRPPVKRSQTVPESEQATPRPT